MNAVGNLVLAYVYMNIDIFFIILIRILGFVILFPIFSAVNIPTIVKVAFSASMSVIVFATGKVGPIQYDDTTMGYIYLFTKEFIVGVMMAFVVYVIFSLVSLMGQMLDFQLGLSMASVYDPMTRVQGPITGNLLNFAIALLFIQAGGLHAFVKVLLDSFSVLPPGKAKILIDGKMLLFIVNIVNEMFMVGIKFALPVIAAIMLIDVALGILVKAVPQVNVFVVGMPLKLFLGFMVLFAIIPLLENIYDFIFNTSYRYTMDLIQGLIR